MTMKTLKRQLAAFWRGNDGTAVIEFVLTMPIVAFAVYMSFVFFDAYRAKNTAQKASFTIADLLSRQTEGADETYLAGLKDLYDFLAKTDPSTTSIRVTSVYYKKNKDLYKVMWSKVVGNNVNKWKTSKLKKLKENLPDVANKEYLILVETFVEYDPPFNGVINSQEFTTFTPISPRFAPQLAWVGS